MKTQKDVLLDLLCLYKEQSQKLKNKRFNYPEGSLLIQRSEKYVQYYHKFKDNKTGKYITKYIKNKDLNTKKRLAQKSYNKKLKNLVYRRLELLEKLCLDFSDYEIEDLYSQMLPERQDLVEPAILPWNEYVNKWLARNDKRSGPNFPFQGIMSKKGEQVRSKSEKIMADMFFDQNIPYKYECPLKLKNQYFYPDFTFLSPYNRKEIYWEHFGMMGDENYAEKAINKIAIYEENNILFGENLIVTFEAKNTSLNSQHVQRLIDRYLIKKST